MTGRDGTEFGLFAGEKDQNGTERNGDFEMRFLNRDRTGRDGGNIFLTGRDGNFQREVFSSREEMVISSGKGFHDEKRWWSPVRRYFLGGKGWHGNIVRPERDDNFHREEVRGRKRMVIIFCGRVGMVYYDRKCFLDGGRW